MKTSFLSCPARKRKSLSLACVWCAVAACFLSACASRSQFQKGYDAGAATTVKRQYWILQNMQKGDETKEARPRMTVYRLPVEPDPNATVKRVPYEIAVPIYE